MSHNLNQLLLFDPFPLVALKIFLLCNEWFSPDHVLTFQAMPKIFLDLVFEQKNFFSRNCPTSYCIFFAVYHFFNIVWVKLIFFSDIKNKKIYCLCDPVFLEKFVCSFH